MTRYAVVCDLETGGTQPHHPNIQIAAIAINQESGVEIDSFERKIQFNETAADPEALKMNHYDRAVWINEAQPSAKVARLFADWSQPYRSIEMKSKAGKPYYVAKLIGHNIVTFDLPRIRAMFGDSFFPFSYHCPDTLQRALWFFEDHPELERPANLKLGTLCTYFGVPVAGAHEALSDVRMAAALARAIRNAEATCYANR